MQALQQQTHTRTTRKTRWPLQTLLIATAAALALKAGPVAVERSAATPMPAPTVAGFLPDLEFAAADVDAALRPIRRSGETLSAARHPIPADTAF